MLRKSRDVNKEIDNLRRDLSSQYRARSRDNTTDNSDITKAVRRLNAQLDQDAPYIVGSFQDLKFSNVMTRQTEEGLSTVQTSEHLVVALMNRLRTTQASDDRRMLLQTAVQAYLASVLYKLASPRTSELHGSVRATGEVSNTLSHFLFQLMRRKKWLTDARSDSHADADIIHGRTGSIVKAIITGLSEILVTAGCTVVQSDVISTVTPKLEQRLIFAVNLAVDLNKKLSGVLSSGLLIVRPGDAFNGQSMKVMEEDQVEIQPGEPVLCTMTLGLVRHIPGETSVSGQEIDLKAGVLLESFLDVGD